MGTTNIVKFAGDTKAQVQSDNAYTAATGPATVGFVDGPADPTQINKALRQSSAVAAAVARLVTDPVQGNQPTFNDSEDIAALALKIKAALLAIPEFSTALKYNDLWRYLLENPATNDLSAKFSPSVINGTTELQRRILAEYGNELFKTILTPKGILANPPIPKFTALEGTPDYTNVVDTSFIFQRHYRQLSNGAIEVRIGVYSGFSVRAPGWVYLGNVPFQFQPAMVQEAQVMGMYCSDNTKIWDALGRPSFANLGVDNTGRVYLYPGPAPKSVRPSVDVGSKSYVAQQNIGMDVPERAQNTGSLGGTPAFEHGLSSGLLDNTTPNMGVPRPTPPGTSLFILFASLTYTPLFQP